MVTVCLLFGLLSPPDSLLITERDAIERGLRFNPDLRRAYRVLETRLAKRLADLAPERPVLSYYQEDVLNGLADRQRFYRYQFSQRFDFPVIYWLKGDGRGFDERAVEAEEEQLAIEYAMLIRIRFATLQLAVRRLEIARKAENMSLDFMRVTQRRFDFGDIGKVPLMRASIEAAKSRNIRVERELQVSVERLALGAMLADTVTCFMPKEDNQDPSQLALSRRTEAPSVSYPSVEAAKQKRLAAEKDYDAASLGWMPSFSMTFFQQRFRPAENEGMFYGGGEIGLSLPLWGWLSEQGKVEESRLWLSAQEEEERARHIEWVTERRIAEQRYHTLQEQYRDLIETIEPASQGAFAAVLEEFEGGYIGYLELMDAQRVLIESEEIVVQKYVEVQIARALLIRWLGRIYE